MEKEVSMKQVRVGAVNYLNTKPLIHNLAQIAPHWVLDLQVPSHLAQALAEEKLDIALIPVIEYFRHPNYRIIPGISIASHGPVLSVTLFSKVPWPEIKSISLDEGSKTSVALLKILSKQLHGITFTSSALPMNADPEKVTTDGVLLIGDRAMKACLSGFPFAYDLGKEWHDYANLPFVYAIWAVHERAFGENLTQYFAKSKKAGLAHVGEIASHESKILGLDAGFCRRYLSLIIQYNLGSREIAGLKLYRHLAYENELIDQERSIDFHDCRTFAKSY